ncbi:MAG: hypothetical protein ACXVBK_16505 [Flavisolibacter sp.]
MKLKTLNLYTCLNLISVIILLGGLGSAILIYRTAEDTPYGVLGYEEGGGTVYPVMPEDSKQYLRGLELYGGKANVLMDQLRRGFMGLWHGKTLAFTIAFITFITSFALFYTANYLLPSRLESNDPSG